MANLINDILLKTGIITEIGNGGAKRVQWFKDVTFADIVVVYIFPLLLFFGIAIYLKMRYLKRKERDEITLRPFFDEEDSDI